MSLPDEKYRSVLRAKDFLRDLLNPKATPRVPREVRKRAYYILKHFLAEYELEEMAKKCPLIIKKPEND